jgi:hypothetical protein
MDTVKSMTLLVIIITMIGVSDCRAAYVHTREYFGQNKKMIWGAIQFPKTLTSIPDMRIYYSGQRIKCETQQESKRVTFAIPDSSQKNQFKILITDKVEFASEYNVIKYLKVRHNTPYKFYVATLTQQKIPLCSLEQLDDDGINSKNILTWHIQEYPNALEKERIPDDTIIICLKASYIEKLDGSNETMLPIIKIRPDIIMLAGSEQRIHDQANELILSLLDYDTIHAAMHQEEVHPANNPKTVLAITT